MLYVNISPFYFLHLLKEKARYFIRSRVIGQSKIQLIDHENQLHPPCLYTSDFLLSTCCDRHSSYT